MGVNVGLDGVVGVPYQLISLKGNRSQALGLLMSPRRQRGGPELLVCRSG